MQKEMKLITETQSVDIALEHFLDKRDADFYFSAVEGNNYSFNNYVGPAAFVAYSEGAVRIVVANDAYLEEIGQHITCEDARKDCLRKASLATAYQKDGWAIYQQAILRAVATGEEQTCETWRIAFSQKCGQAEICLSNKIKLIASGPQVKLLFVRVQNVTEERLQLQQVSSSENKFRSAAEQANIYAWEYDIASKEMRPCSRCMRDLGLPPLLKNYPEPVIEAGIFPQDYADMFRHWHQELAEGTDHLEGIIPLTKDRIPFHVRYTTEFNEQHQPVRAFGSATLVVETDEREYALGEIINALNKNFLTVMKIDLAANSGVVMKYGSTLPGWLLDYALEKKPFQFSSYCSRYIRELAHPDDVPWLMEATAPEAIMKAVAENEDYSIIYRILFAGAVHYMQVRFFQLKDKKTVICAFQNVDAMVETQQRTEKELKDALSSAREANAVKEKLLYALTEKLQGQLFALQLLMSKGNVPEELEKIAKNLEQLVADLQA